MYLPSLSSLSLTPSFSLSAPFSLSHTQICLFTKEKKKTEQAQNHIKTPMTTAQAKVDRVQLGAWSLREQWPGDKVKSLQSTRLNSATLS